MNLCTCTRRRRPGHGLGGQSPTGHPGGSGVLHGQSCVGYMVDRVARDRFFSGHFRYLLSVYLHQCSTRTSVFCCQNVSTRTSVSCCRSMSTIALHPPFFCCQYVSTSSPHALQFSAIIMSPLALQFSAASMSPPIPKGSNSLSLTLHIQVTLAVYSIVK
jgi:hypothetical protein